MWGGGQAPVEHAVGGTVRGGGGGATAAVLIQRLEVPLDRLRARQRGEGTGARASNVKWLRGEPKRGRVRFQLQSGVAATGRGHAQDGCSRSGTGGALASKPERIIPAQSAREVTLIATFSRHDALNHP